jgi:two-component system nitrate/nitrite response regulator NarL
VVENGVDETDGVGARCRALVLSSSPLVAETLAELIKSFDGFDANHRALRGGDCLEDEADPPDLVLLETPSVDGVVELGTQIRSVWPWTVIVMVVRAAAPWCNRIASEVGAVGWVTCEIGEGDLRRSLTMAHERGRLPDLLVSRAARRPAPTDEEFLVGLLTAREVEVLRLLATGQSAGDIARQLVISPNTVRTHVQNIMLKLGVHSRLEAVALARRAGLFAPAVIDLDALSSRDAEPSRPATVPAI